MGGFIVQCDGKSVTMPFGGGWMVPPLDGRLPNDVLLRMDEVWFKRSFEPQAVWTQGSGEFASLAYCGELTIQRYKTLDEAITAKRAIDGGGCGGKCCKVHLIVHIDPTNSRHAREQENIRAHIASGGKSLSAKKDQ